jgi:hypothetical protein
MNEYRQIYIAEAWVTGNFIYFHSFTNYNYSFFLKFFNKFLVI